MKANLDRLNVNDIFTKAFDQQKQTNNYGTAPEFNGLTNWINSDPLTLESLRGKVVLVDFWTYSCINCLRTLPHVTSWYDTYKNDGLVVIGVHTPEFDFEKIPTNVQRAVKDYRITYPVAQDNDYATWQAYKNHYWPAHYLINKNGEIVYTHFGEGNYDVTENTIRSLLDMPPTTSTSKDDIIQSQTPEIYFGSSRLEYLTTKQKALQGPSTYTFPTDLELNNFAFEGKWDINSDFSELMSDGAIRLHFKAAKVHFVAEAPETITATVLIDGEKIKQLDIQASSLYTLFESNKMEDHILEIRFTKPSLKAFTFTFG